MNNVNSAIFASPFYLCTCQLYESLYLSRTKCMTSSLNNKIYSLHSKILLDLSLSSWGSQFRARNSDFSVMCVLGNLWNQILRSDSELLGLVQIVFNKSYVDLIRCNERHCFNHLYQSI